MIRTIRITLVGLLILIGTGLVGSWALYWRIGRTPAELMRYAEQELQGHPRIEAVALPMFDTLREWLGEPARGESLPTFLVPRLPPNPALESDLSATGQVAQGADRAVTDVARDGKRIIRVGPHRSVTSIGLAARMAKDGDIVEIDAGDYPADVAVWSQADITIRGKGDRVRLIALGARAEDKAIWVIRGGRVSIDNIDFIGATVSDRNGAGIRFETGKLTISNCLFFNNETGLLTSAGPESELVIEGSEFGYNGNGDGQTHNLYVGQIRSLVVTGSYFHHGNVGHLIKSRAARNFIAYNRITDETGGRASYELEFPQGGVAYVLGNIIQKGSQASNSTLISFGAEGLTYRENKLYLAHNTLVNDLPYGGTFLRVASGAQRVKTSNNLLVGQGRLDVAGILESSGDVRVDWESFAQASRQDYRLNAKGRRNVIQSAGSADGMDLTPNSEYLHPKGLLKLTAPPAFPGAIQNAAP